MAEFGEILNLSLGWRHLVTFLCYPLDGSIWWNFDVILGMAAFGGILMLSWVGATLWRKL
jgi:hypothetical protein